GDGQLDALGTFVAQAEVARLGLVGRLVDAEPALIPQGATDHRGAPEHRGRRSDALERMASRFVRHRYRYVSVLISPGPRHRVRPPERARSKCAQPCGAEGLAGSPLPGPDGLSAAGPATLGSRCRQVSRCSMHEARSSRHWARLSVSVARLASQVLAVFC